MKQLRHYVHCRQPAPLGGTRVQAADGDLAAEPGSTSGPCCVDFFPKKYRWSGNASEKNPPLYKRHRIKIEPWGILTFTPEILFFLLVRLQNLLKDAKKLHENEQRCSCRANSWKPAEGLNRAALWFSSEDVM